MLEYLESHGIEFVLAFWVFSAFVSGMPDITAQSGFAYIWAYRSLHTLAGNLSTLANKLNTTVVTTEVKTTESKPKDTV